MASNIEPVHVYRKTEWLITINIFVLNILYLIKTCIFSSLRISIKSTGDVEPTGKEVTHRAVDRRAFHVAPVFRTHHSELIPGLHVLYPFGYPGLPGLPE